MRCPLRELVILEHSRGLCQLGMTSTRKDLGEAKRYRQEYLPRQESKLPKINMVWITHLDGQNGLSSSQIPMIMKIFAFSNPNFQLFPT